MMYLATYILGVLSGVVGLALLNWYFACKDGAFDVEI